MIISVEKDSIKMETVEISVLANLGISNPYIQSAAENDLINDRRRRHKSPQEKSSWIYRILNILSRKSQTRGNLESLIVDAAENEVIDNDMKDIIVGAMQVSEMHARDIIIPRTQMKVIAVDSKLEDILPLIIQSAHSRYPVVGENPDDVLGILLAKDLLPQILDPKNVV